MPGPEHEIPRVVGEIVEALVDQHIEVEHGDPVARLSERGAQIGEPGRRPEPGPHEGRSHQGDADQLHTAFCNTVVSSTTPI